MQRITPGLQVTPVVRLVRKLGEGGMGSVWLAEHEALKTTVAVKFVAVDDAAFNEEAKQRLAMEASATAQLSTPHAVQVFDVGALDNGVPFIVMEQLQGHDLDHLLERDEVLDWELCQQVAVEAGRALKAAHAVGVIHRDIKPANLFLAEQGDGQRLIKVLDFGIAMSKRLLVDKRLTADGVLVGTPMYMCRDAMLDPKEPRPGFDLWSLTVVLYECLTGINPFGADTVADVCDKVVQGKAAPPSSLDPSLPVALDAFFARALSWEEDERYASADALSAAFTRCFAPAGARMPALTARLGSQLAASEPVGGVGPENGDAAVSSIDHAHDGRQPPPQDAAVRSTPGPTAPRVAPNATTTSYVAGVTAEPDRSDEPVLDTHEPATSDAELAQSDAELAQGDHKLAQNDHELVQSDDELALADTWKASDAQRHFALHGHPRAPVMAEAMVATNKTRSLWPRLLLVATATVALLATGFVTLRPDPVPAGNPPAQLDASAQPAHRAGPATTSAASPADKPLRAYSAGSTTERAGSAPVDPEATSALGIRQAPSSASSTARLPSPGTSTTARPQPAGSSPAPAAPAAPKSPSSRTSHDALGF